jgi:hypothetical protein
MLLAIAEVIDGWLDSEQNGDNSNNPNVLTDVL